MPSHIDDFHIDRRHYENDKTCSKFKFSFISSIDFTGHNK